MGIWIELMCDLRADNPPGYVSIDPYCYTHAGVGTGVLTHNTTSAMRSGYGTLAKEAEAKGWVNRKGVGWMCPNCRKLYNKG